MRSRRTKARRRPGSGPRSTGRSRREPNSLVALAATVAGDDSYAGHRWPDPGRAGRISATGLGVAIRPDMRSVRTSFAILSVLAGVATGCATDDPDVEDGESDMFPDGKADGGLEDGTPEARGVLA